MDFHLTLPDSLLLDGPLEFSELPPEECGREGVGEVVQPPSAVRMNVSLDWLDNEPNPPLPEGARPRIKAAGACASGGRRDPSGVSP